MLTARILTKKVKILLNFTPPRSPFFEQFNFYAYLCDLKNAATIRPYRKQRIQEELFRNAYVFIATANQTKLQKKNN